MKKVLSFILMALVVTALFVSCDDSDSWVTLVYTAEDFENAVADEGITTIYLGKNITIDDLSAPLEITRDLTINLDNKTLTVKNAETVETRDDAAAFNILKNAKVIVENGEIVGYNGTTFCLKEDGADLTLDGVKATLTNEIAETPTYWKAKDGSWITPKVVQIYQCIEPTLTVKNSILTVEHGSYGIGSNATVADNKVAKMTVAIDTTTVETKSDDSTALLLNVPGTVTITGSTIIGDRQGAILRGGDHTISNSKFEYKTNNEENKGFESANWKDGNAVPNAAIVIGNRGGSYEYVTTVTFNGTNTLTVPEGSNQLYVYQADATDARKVTVSGADSSWTVNEEKNGATYTTN